MFPLLTGHLQFLKQKCLLGLNSFDLNFEKTFVTANIPYPIPLHILYNRLINPLISQNQIAGIIVTSNFSLDLSDGVSINNIFFFIGCNFV